MPRTTKWARSLQNADDDGRGIVFGVIRPANSRAVRQSLLAIPLGGPLPVPPDNVDQSLATEQFAIRLACFLDAVGNQHEDVAGFEVDWV